MLEHMYIIQYASSIPFTLLKRSGVTNARLSRDRLNSTLAFSRQFIDIHRCHFWSTQHLQCCALRDLKVQFFTRWIFSDIPHAIHKPNISTWSPNIVNHSDNISYDSQVMKMVETVTWFLELVRHRISTILGVKISGSYMPYGTMLGSNKSQLRICRFCSNEQNGCFWGPLGLGTENEDGWELSSQILWSTSQDIFSAHIHCNNSPPRVQLKLSRLC